MRSEGHSPRLTGAQLIPGHRRARGGGAVGQLHLADGGEAANGLELLTVGQGLAEHREVLLGRPPRYRIPDGVVDH
jgi:hypothetical protein